MRIWNGARSAYSSKRREKLRAALGLPNMPTTSASVTAPCAASVFC
jgi:hypothetical protein